MSNNKQHVIPFTSMIIFIILLIILEFSISIISSNKVLLLVTTTLSIVQISIIMVLGIRRFNFDYYKKIGILGVYNSVVFSITSAFLIGKTAINILIVMLVLFIVSLIEIITFELLTKRNKIKQSAPKCKNVINPSNRKNKIVSCLFIIVFLIIKIFEIDILSIFKIASTLLSISLMFFYLGIIKSRTNQGTV